MSEGKGHAVAKRWSTRVAACAAACVAALVGGAAACAPLVRVDVRSVSASVSGAEGEPTVAETGVGAAWRMEGAWPVRWGTGRRSLGAGRYGVIRRTSGPLVPLRADSEAEKQVEKEMLDDIYALLGSRRSPSWRDNVTAVGEGKGAFVYQYEKPLEERVAPPPHAATFFLKFISATRDAADDGDGDERSYKVKMQRTWVGYYEPVRGVRPGDVRGADGAWPATPPVPRGMVVVLPGVFGTPANVVDQLVQTLRSKGFGVVRLLAHPSRFTERAEFDYRGTSESDLDSFAAGLAAELGDRTAECAYAVEECVARIGVMRPETRGVERIALGLSGGAMVLPTVVARNPSAYGAAVLVAGGADLCRVAVESNYTPWINAVSVKWGGRTPTMQQSLALSAAYLRHAPLDPYHTAAALRDKPVLMLHAQGDEAVPAALGELLWERCGRPDRWVYDSGHEMLFATLSGRIAEIVEWVEGNVQIAK